MHSSAEPRLRTFVGVPLPAEIVQALQPALVQLREIGVKASWTRPESLHVTLVFLGATSQEQLQALVPAMRQSMEGVSSFETRIHGMGAFPHLRRPSVLWAGAHAEQDAWHRLHAAAQSAAATIDIAVETRPFHPHATLARVKEQPPPALRDVMGTLAAFDAGAFRVERVILFESKLGAGGSRYMPLAEFPLA